MAKTTTRSRTATIRFSPENLASAEKVAALTGRTVSSLAEYALVLFMRQNYPLAYNPDAVLASKALASVRPLARRASCPTARRSSPGRCNARHQWRGRVRTALDLSSYGGPRLRIEPRLGYVAARAIDADTGRVLHCAALKELLHRIADDLPRMLAARNFQ